MQVNSSLIVQITPPTQQVLPAQFIQEHQTLANEWNMVPFYGDHSINPRFNKVLQLLRTPDLIKPSVQAGINPQNIVSPTIHLVDVLFITKLEDYLIKLKDAITRDIDASLAQRDTSHDFMMAAATGSARFIQHTPNIIIIKQVTCPLLALTGAIYGWIYQESITLERINMERSFARQQWLDNVLRAEQDRLQQSRNIIEQRVQLLVLEIDQAQDLIDVAIFDELMQLDRLSRFIDPHHPLQIRGLSISAFIQQNTPQG